MWWEKGIKEYVIYLLTESWKYFWKWHFYCDDLSWLEEHDRNCRAEGATLDKPRVPNLPQNGREPAIDTHRLTASKGKEMN